MPGRSRSWSNQLIARWQKTVSLSKNGLGLFETSGLSLTDNWIHLKVFGRMVVSLKGTCFRPKILVGLIEDHCQMYKFCSFEDNLGLVKLVTDLQINVVLIQ